MRLGRHQTSKTSAWHYTLSSITLSFVVALCSCTKEPIPSWDTTEGAELEVRIALPMSSLAPQSRASLTEEGNDDENRITKVNVLVFTNSGVANAPYILESQLVADNLTTPSSTHPLWGTNQTLIVPILNPTQPKKIYVIANWSGEPTFITGSYTEAMLKKEVSFIGYISDIKVDPTHPILMSGSKEVANIKNEGYKVEVPVARQLAKFRTKITMSKATRDAHPSIEWLTGDMKLMVGNVPDTSYVIEGSIVSNDALRNRNTPFSVNFTEGSDNYQWVNKGIYVTENLAPTGIDYSTYIIVQLPYKNTITQVTEVDNYYKIPVNDTRAESTLTPHKLLRNTIYDFNINILGIGLPVHNLTTNVGVEDQLTVIPWKQGANIETDDTPQKYFIIDRMLVGLSYIAEQQIIKFKTNVADWKLIKKGTTDTIFSASDLPAGKRITVDDITYQLSGTATDAVITITKAEGVLAIMKNEFTFVARNMKVPFTVVYDSGFIPNSVLTAAGWPTDKLPKTGLQLAKRGNQRLPSGVAEAEDSKMMWKTTNTATAGVETIDDFAQAKLGMGKGSTDAMVATPALAAEHIAANYCREMGPDWYLPSVAELVLIYNNHSTFGASYTFGATTLCWSATQLDTSVGWFVYFSSGDPFKVNKTFPNGVRCVREI